MKKVWTKEYEKEYLKKWWEKHPEYYKNWEEKHPEYLKNWYKEHPNYRKRYVFRFLEMKNKKGIKGRRE